MAQLKLRFEALGIACVGDWVARGGDGRHIYFGA